MNLNTVAVLVKKYLWIPGLVILLVILSALIFLRISPKNKNENLKLISKPDITTQPIQTAIFTTTKLAVDKNTPKTLPIYKTDNSNDLPPNADALASKLNLISKPGNTNSIYHGQGLEYTGESGELIVYKDYLSYRKITRSQKVASEPNYVIEDLVQEAKNFLGSIPSTNQIWGDQQITYNHDIAEDVVENKNPSGSGSVNIQLNWQLSGTKVLITENDVVVTFNNSGDLIRASYRSLSTETAGFQYPIINFDEALNNLQKGDKKVVRIIGPGDITARETKKLASADLTKAYLAYFLPAKTPDYLQPAWVFEGESLIGNQPVYLTFAVPAIDPKFFIQSSIPKP